MTDSEYGEAEHLILPSHQAKKGKYGILKKIVMAICLLAAAFGIGILAVHCDRSFHPASEELIQAERQVSMAAHELASRGDCNETADAFESSLAAVTGSAPGSTGLLSSTSHFFTETPSTVATAEATEITSEPAGESVPISTQTALSTIYSVMSTEGVTDVTYTITATTTVTLYPGYYSEAESNTDICNGVATETVMVTVYPVPDLTVTESASTVTNVNTDISYTTRLPDVTLSGSPSTLTAIQTDVSYTAGPPDATVSGYPNTVTNVQTEVSLTSGLPDATTSGEPSTVTDFQITWPVSLTTTYTSPFTVVTVTDLWDSSSSATSPPAETEQVTLSTFTTVISSAVFLTVTEVMSHEASSSTAGASSSVGGDVITPSSTRGRPTVTYTKVVTATDGTPAVQTTIVVVSAPPPAYTDYDGNTTSTSTSATGTDSSTSATTSAVVTPVVVSGGNKKPEPKGWGGTNGSGHLGCTVMLIAAIMCMF